VVVLLTAAVVLGDLDLVIAKEGQNLGIAIKKTESDLNPRNVSDRDHEIVKDLNQKREKDPAHEIEKDRVHEIAVDQDQGTEDDRDHDQEIDDTGDRGQETEIARGGIPGLNLRAVLEVKRINVIAIAIPKRSPKKRNHQNQNHHQKIL